MSSILTGGFGPFGSGGTPAGPALSRLRSELVARCEDLMEAVGLSTSTSANPALDGPIAWAYARLGLVPAAGVAPSADELDALAAARFWELADLGEYRILATCRNRWTKVRIQVGANSLYLSDLRDSLDRRLAQLETMATVKDALGIGAGSLSGGSIRLAGSLATADDDAEACA